MFDCINRGGRPGKEADDVTTGRGEINNVFPVLPIPRSFYISCSFCCDERPETSYVTNVIQLYLEDTSSNDLVLYSPRRRNGIASFLATTNVVRSFAIAGWSLPALSFAIFTIANVSPRAVQVQRSMRSSKPMSLCGSALGLCP